LPHKVSTAATVCRGAGKLLILPFCALALVCCSRAGGPSTLPMWDDLPASRTRQFLSTSSVQQLQNGSKPPRYKVLFNFGSSVYGYYGVYPLAGLINVNGTLYGTTEYGGSYGYGSYVGYGTVFSITTGGTESVIHSFGGGSDGASPVAGLVDLNGTLYGTTSTDGAYGAGTVFSISPTGAQYQVLHSFGSGSDGAQPMADLVVVKGKLYGTTYTGGVYGDGTVFSITTGGKEAVLHSFTVSPGSRGADGSEPLAGLVAFKGKLYGTTEWGGTGDEGTVFGITTTGTETMLYSFGGGLPAGRHPVADLIAVKSTLYGTTYSGGANDWGTVFSIRPNGADESVLYSFGNSPDGAYPAAGVTYVHGKFYGTTYAGGTNTIGTIFKATVKGKEHVVHSFGADYGNDGNRPLAGLLDVGGTLYGTTEEGGVELPSCPHSGNICDWGTVFALTP
jgi:uncharacterized repeat protein (TIGR03803 family)